MKKIVTILLLALLLVGAVFALTGCEVKSERNDKTFSTVKSTTKCGFSGCKTTKRTCPFWDRNC